MRRERERNWQNNDDSDDRNEPNLKGVSREIVGLEEIDTYIEVEGAQYI